MDDRKKISGDIAIRSGQRLELEAPTVLWRVRQGLVGLAAPQCDGEAGAAEALARPGDLLGVPNLLGPQQTIAVRGVTDAVLEVVLPQHHSAAELLGAAYAQACRQHRELMRLQKGAVADRVRDLLVMLTEQGCGHLDASAMTLPTLGVLAWVIDSTEESVCRVLARLRDLRVLEATAPSRTQRIVQDLRSLKSPRGMTASTRAAVHAFIGAV